MENIISNGPARIFDRRWLIIWLRLYDFKVYQVDVSIISHVSLNTLVWYPSCFGHCQATL
jgi:hypothetical protein